MALRLSFLFQGKYLKPVGQALWRALEVLIFADERRTPSGQSNANLAIELYQRKIATSIQS